MLTAQIYGHNNVCSSKRASALVHEIINFPLSCVLIPQVKQSIAKFSVIQHFQAWFLGTEAVIRSSEYIATLYVLQCVVLWQPPLILDTRDKHRASSRWPCCCWCHHSSVPEAGQTTSHNPWISQEESATYLPQATNHSSDLQWNKYMIHCQDAFWKSSPDS